MSSPFPGMDPYLEDPALWPDDPDSELDLQLMLDTAYDRAIYDQEVDYRSAATPPLTPEQEDWANRLLRAKGLR